MAKNMKNEATVEIKPGMKIALEVRLKNSADGVEKILSLNSIVEETLDDGCLLIQMPMHQGYYYPLPIEEKIVMYLFLEPMMYALPVQFQEQIWKENLLYAKMLPAGKIGSFQRRNCYRLPCSFPISVKRLQMQEKNSTSEPQSIQGKTINFSDSGMLFATDEYIEKGEKITLTFHIGRTETTEATVFRSERNIDGSYRFKTAVQFLHDDKDPTQRQRFYRYIVEKQLEERRRHTQGY